MNAGITLKSAMTACLLGAAMQMAGGLSPVGPLAPGTAHAADAGAFLERLAGEYRGRGTAKLNGRDDAEKVSCKISNRYDASSKALIVKGNCASTQGKSSVSGKMTHQGDSVRGSLFASGESAVTKSEGSVKNGKLTVTTNFVNKTTQRLTRTIQIIQQSGSGFKAQFYVYDNSKKKFEPSGQLSFSGS